MFNILLEKTDLFKDFDVYKLENGYYNMSEVLRYCNSIRLKNNLSLLKFPDYTKTMSTKEFFDALQEYEGDKVIWIKGVGGRNPSPTVCHPSIFVDFVLWALPKLKVKVYKYVLENKDILYNDFNLEDNEIEFLRKIFCNLYEGHDFTKFLIITCNRIKKACNHKGDWNSANEQQLKLRDTIHNEIAKLSNVFDNPKQIVDIAIKMNTNKEFIS